MHPLKTKEVTEKIILMVPLLAAFLWMVFLVLDSQQPEPGMKLAPSRLDSLINALFAFIIVYAIVLVVLFYQMHKSVHKEEPKKRIKKKK